jgi:hypothetical protein
MKKLLVIFSAALIVCFTSCKKDSLDEVQPVQATFQLNFATAVKDLNFPLTNAVITLTNKLDGKINSATADASGKVVFASITPGNYSAVATLTISASEYSNLTGTTVSQDVVFNASSEANIVAGTAPLQLTLQSGKLGDWTIKQIYYGGSSSTNGALYRDQFIEIFNNSTDVLYADSLYISLIYGKNTRVSSVDITQPAFQQNGQLNWANSIGMNATNANTAFIYIKSLLMIQGTGKQYPVQPGASIIIAQNAINHKTPYTGTDGKSYSVKQPELTIDLSGADFETYYGDIPGLNPLGSDTDNPNVKNVKVLMTDDRDMILNNNGYEGVAIFKMKDDPITALPGFPSPEAKTVTSTTILYKQLPIGQVIDAVDIAHTSPASRAAKRMPDPIDAGFAFTQGGSYSSQSVIRKTSKVLNGRRILKDTNNSTNDFDYLILADPTKTIFK